MNPEKQHCKCPNCGANPSADSSFPKPMTLVEAPELLRFKEAAEILGVHPDTLGRLVRRRKLRRHPSMKRIVKSDLAGFINEKTRFEKAVVKAAR